jgi:RAMP superfamily.
MRAYGAPFRDGTKVDLVHRAEANADYSSRLQVLNDRIKRIANDTFQVTCPWRIRVGGAKGPESMLLPAFDHLGIPYIPSSTLRGVARTQAIRELMRKRNLSWKRRIKQWHPGLASRS